MEIKILDSDYACCDPDYGNAIVKFEIPKEKFVGFCFVEYKDYKNPTEEEVKQQIIDHIEHNGGLSEFPKAVELSEELLDLIEDSYFDMKFVEEEDMSEEMAEELLAEAEKYGSLDCVIEPGDCELTLYAGAMCCVNFYDHKEYGQSA